MSFASILKKLRAQAGLSQPGLADASGVPVATIRVYEQGKREPLLANATKLARALNVSVDVLAENTAEPAPARGQNNSGTAGDRGAKAKGARKKGA